MPTALEKYTAEFETIRTDPDYPFGLAPRFVATLLALETKDRYTLQPLLEKIEDDAFQRDFEIRNLDLGSYLREKAEWEKKPPKVEPAPVAVRDDFNDVLFRDSAEYVGVFKIKGTFVFKLGNIDGGATQTVLLCDDASRKHPEVCSLDGNESGCKGESLEGFLQDIEADAEKRKANYLAVILITPSLQNGEKIVANLETLGSHFDDVSFVVPKVQPLASVDDYELKGFEDGIEFVKGYVTKVLNNRDISFGDEAIIKTLFVGSDMILDYKFLKKGNTGAKVIEIQPLKGYTDSMARFVVKYAEKGPKCKLKEEKQRYEEHVGQYAVNYSAQWGETSTHQAIRYKYASVDARTDSYPFSSIVDNALLEKSDIPYDPKPVIVELFSSELFPLWNNSRRQVTQKIKEIYSEYLNKEDDVIEAAAVIKNRTIADAESTELVSNYRKIVEYALKTNQKICHGDLHSENFFKDNAGVYLIDFGWTGVRHAVIDHATLEASLKFKHIPFYVRTDYLITQEEEKLTDIGSFRDGFDLSSIDRPIVRQIFELICEIRKNAVQHLLSPDSPLEYLLALYVITFRQILYADLNQRYALASANMLGKKIVEQLAL
jgi:hypothetical protein